MAPRERTRNYTHAIPSSFTDIEGRFGHFFVDF
jgi:hypothetical protein